MLNRDTWQEIWIALRQNKLRTILTGFAISWGIFMLVLLSSISTGFLSFTTRMFQNENKNTVSIFAGPTSLPYKGHPANRFIHFTDKDWEIIAQNPNVETLSPEVRTQCLCHRNDQSTSIQLMGVKPVFADLQNITLQSGRFLNQRDIASSEKSVVVNTYLVNKLFKPGEEVLGAYLYINSTPFKVVGIFIDKQQSSPVVIAPVEVVKRMFHITEYWRLTFTTKEIYTIQQDEALRERLFQTLARYHEISPEDRHVFWIRSTIENMKQTRTVTAAIKTFIWIIGIAMLISGVVGVGNIMLVTVKERTNEIGIRKALGAKPAHILSSIVMEAVVITVLFGLIGMLLAVLLATLIGVITSSMGGDMGMFQPKLDLSTAFGALFVMILSGVLAGYLPARKAVKIKPIEAIQYR